MPPGWLAYRQTERGSAADTTKETMPRARPRTAGPLAPLAAKVPEITVLFWILKVPTTGMGESIPDHLGEVNVALAAAVGVVGPRARCACSSAPAPTGRWSTGGAASCTRSSRSTRTILGR